MDKTQRKHSLILLVILLPIFVFAYVSFGQYKQRTEEGLVYLSLFQPNPYIEEFKHLIVFSNPSICKSGKNHIKGFPEDVFEKFKMLNTEGANPIKLSALEGKIPIVGWKDTKVLHKKGLEDWLNPKGYRLLSLSRVGFNDSKDQAIACIEVFDRSFKSYGRSYGYAMIFYFKKSNGEWGIADFRNVYRS